MSMKRTKVLIEENYQDFEKIAKKYNLRLILLFGSAVSSKLHPQSDIDIAVLSEKPDLSLESYSNLLFDLQRRFPKREVDLAIINRADPLFLKKIMENCKLLCGNPRELARLKIYAFKRYVDHRRYFDLEKKFAQNFIKRYATGL
ncbi:nucleotidyltransferase domain-containing protein [Candidatus Oleimmundimicrobium sp.]|uniref:type VII toxin-antitoxin system MntA family adenylyltransferase antitoxin n=1 Tax=Candidatus Oleimmundimicrobium sp. TaxID=3060597 RepID=UPI002716C1CE|nr:nucleotidyltransferase domain-containing protein [Candidatus Oleimmundimicrobium sp.]MDO8886406.1 nucleotidyltransferase domain-containing protein [Candidatus Oleimmundimicrobium sp.]